LSAIGRPQPAPDLLGMARDVFALKEQQARTQELLRQQERQRQYEALASQYGEDPERFIAEVSRIDPMQGQKFSEQLSKARKEQAAANTQQLKAEREHFEIGLSRLQGATPENYAIRRQWVTSTFPQLAQALPEQYDEAAVSSLLQTGLSTKDFLAAQADAAERM